MYKIGIPVVPGCALVHLLIVHSAASWWSSQESSRGLDFEIQPVSLVFRTADDVVLRLTLGNGVRTKEGCSVVYIDPVFYPESTPGRPFSALKLQILDERGTAVEGEQWTSTYPSLRASDLIPLQCGFFYGAAVRISRADWNYRLAKGHYRVRGFLSINVRSFMKQRPELLSEFVRLTGYPEDLALKLLAEGSFTTNEISFEVLED